MSQEGDRFMAKIAFDSGLLCEGELFLLVNKDLREWELEVLLNRENKCGLGGRGRSGFEILMTLMVGQNKGP